MDRPEQGIRLIEILKGSGLIPPQHLERALAEYQKTGDSILDVLRRDVSFRALRDLLTYEIPLPFGGGKGQKLKDILVQSGVFSDQELVEALQKDGQTGGNLGQLLIARGFLTESQLARALKQQAQTGHPLWRTLINMNLIAPSVITEILRQWLTEPQEDAQDELIINLLTGMKLITPAQKLEAQENRKKTGQQMIKFLIGKGYISAEKVGATMEKQLAIPYINLNMTEVDRNVVYTLPENLVRDRQLIPVRREGNDLYLAMSNPLDAASVAQVAMMTGCEVHPLLAAEPELIAFIDKYYLHTDQVPAPRPQTLAANDATPVGDIPAVQLATSIIEGAINARATDIHLEPQLPSMRVRYRIDGQLYDVMSIPQSIEQAVFSRIKILADLDITERRRPQDGHIVMRVQGRELNMRISCIPTYLGEKMVIRLLDEANVLRGLRQLGLENEDEQKIRMLLAKPHGMILVTGPVGSGKTTTLYSCLNELNILQTNIVTIEDPVEYRLAGINQVQVNPVVGLTFAAGLRSILRQDPDVLMVGEIRDADTAKVATWAALTGQLVMATLHTRDSAAAVAMLTNFGVERFLIASAVEGVIAQRLVRRLCTECRETYTPDAAAKKALHLEGDGPMSFGRSLGCKNCNQTGYYGRTGIFEVMLLTPEINTLVMEGTTDRTLLDLAVKQGTTPLWDNGLKKVLSGMTSPEEVLREVAL